METTQSQGMYRLWNNVASFPGSFPTFCHILFCCRVPGMQQNAWEEPGNEARKMYNSNITCDKLYFVNIIVVLMTNMLVVHQNVLFVPQFLTPQCSIMCSSVTNPYTQVNSKCPWLSQLSCNFNFIQEFKAHPSLSYMRPRFLIYTPAEPGIPNEWL